MPKRQATLLAAPTIPAAIVAGLCLRWTRPWMSPTERAYRPCGLCAHTTDLVDRWIPGSHDATLTPEQQVALFETMYTDAAELEQGRQLCSPCAEAVLDVAFKDRGP